MSLNHMMLLFDVGVGVGVIISLICIWYSLLRKRRYARNNLNLVRRTVLCINQDRTESKKTKSHC